MTLKIENVYEIIKEDISFLKKSQEGNFFMVSELNKIINSKSVNIVNVKPLLSTIDYFHNNENTIKKLNSKKNYIKYKKCVENMNNILQTFYQWTTVCLSKEQTIVMVSPRGGK